MRSPGSQRLFVASKNLSEQKKKHWSLDCQWSVLMTSCEAVGAVALITSANFVEVVVGKRAIFFRVGLMVFAEVEHYPNKAHQAAAVRWADVRWRSSRLGGEVPDISMWANDAVRWELDVRLGQNYHTASWQSSRTRMGWKLPGRSWPVLFVQCLGTSPACPSTFFGIQKIMNF